MAESGRGPARSGLTAVFTRAGEPLRYVEQEVPDPGPGEILARVTMAGICGTDAHRLNGDLETPPRPVTFGHEAVGQVEAIGPGVATDRAGEPLRVGDRVYWSPSSPCGHCGPCRREWSTMFCENAVWPVPFGDTSPAAFQQFATIGPTAPLHRLPDTTNPGDMVAFGCAMPTVLGGLARVGGVEGLDVAIQGCGPVGLANTVLCAIEGARSITVIGAPSERLGIARRFGATDTVDLDETTAGERRARVEEATEGRGADVVIEAAGHISAFAEGLALTSSYGRYVIMGLYSGHATTPVNPVDLNNRNVSIIGTLGAPAASYRDAVRVVTEHGQRLGFGDLITHRYGLGDLERAIDAAHTKEAIKAVVEPARSST